ncbi:ornithine decarboxylase [Escherichia albertii]|uniref:ornithine decarboxylase n=1 Tax=Escherichia albertii TaxID=208962 RepID=UPI0039BF5ACC
MKLMGIAASGELVSRLSTHRRVVALEDTDFTDIAAVVITAADSRSGILTLLKRIGFQPPVFLFSEYVVELPAGVTALINGNEQHWLELESAACRYEENLLPPFYDTLTQYVEMDNSTFACPGHQHGAFFKKHPAGRHFHDFFGENVFRADMCNADVKLGDLLIHEGSAKDAQKFAARVFHADKTYFVLNGTSAANKVVTNALLTRGDLVLFDRNNHKSNHHGALIQAGATPVYLEAARNPFGFIGGIDAHCFNEDYLRQQIRDIAPEKAEQPRPFRLAIIQLGTYDGTIYNARQVIDTIGHLCDYILFDSAWVGYEQFIPMMADSSPLLLALNENDPGIFVTQSVHKQQAGFSQTSQIHKKDNHIRGQARFCPHKRLNNAFMLHASTSPFYPLFAALDVNAKIHEGESGRRLWAECVELGIDARKAILARCKLFRPFIPPVVDGKLWQDYPTSVLASDRRFFSFEPGAKWHGFEGYAEDQYFVDPCKLLLTTPGIDAQTGEYSDFGVPATILAQFEQHIEDDSPLAEVLPGVYNKYPVRYRDYTLRQLCQEMHDLYVSFDVKDLQKAMFRQQSFPPVVMNPLDAHSAYIRGEVELVRIRDAKGRIAAEGALPYPPGVLCVVPGEVWGGAVQRYFLALEEGGNLLPGFSPELQGVYSETDADGMKRLYGYVLK